MSRQPKRASYNTGIVRKPEAKEPVRDVDWSHMAPRPATILPHPTRDDLGTVTDRSGATHLIALPCQHAAPNGACRHYCDEWSGA